MFGGEINCDAAFIYKFMQLLVKFTFPSYNRNYIYLHVHAMLHKIANNKCYLNYTHHSTVNEGFLQFYALTERWNYIKEDVCCILCKIAFYCTE